MPTTKVTRFLNFGAKYYQVPRPASATKSILDTPTHPLLIKYQDKVDQRDRNSLWQTITTYALNEKRVVRTKASRKLRLAFREALHEYRYDEKGKPLEEGEKPPLIGSVEVVPFKSTALAKHEDLKKEMRRLVKHIERAQEIRSLQNSNRTSS